MSVEDNICGTCKHWGGQGTICTITELNGEYRGCMAYMFGDMDNPNFKPMPEWVVTYGSLGSAKGRLEVHKDYSCINHNKEFEK